ncbi:MAG: helix-turn-helix domain-containing protein [Rhizobacter sp.]
MPTPPAALRQMHFDNTRLARVGLELLTLAQLRGSWFRQAAAEPERVAFGLILVIHAGHGEHGVDFQRIPLQPGAVVFVRPGQVQQWCFSDGLEGDVLLIAPHVMQPSATTSVGLIAQTLSLETWPTRFELSVRERRNWRALRVMLRRELKHTVVDDLSAALARELYLCMLVWLARAARDDAPPANVHELLYRRFQRELESLVATRPSVQALAQTLRVSPTTLNRACHAQLGRSAKEMIDRRIALEAQRMLVHSGATSAEIGERLGFSEPTNFLKFFKRQIGMTPEAFRVSHRVA